MEAHSDFFRVGRFRVYTYLVTITNNMTKTLAISFIQKRIAVSVMAVAMLFGVFAFASPADAFMIQVPSTTPSSTGVKTPAQLQAMINSLMKQVAALQAQIAKKEAGVRSTGVSPSVIPPVTNITRNLGLGTKGSQVEVLQECLADLGHYKATLSGVYDATTRNAVQAFQAKEGIVSSGNAWTTGYGYVGPKTRRAINAACVTTTSPGGFLGGGVRVPDSQAKLTASPKTGDAPLTVKFKSNYGDSSGRSNVPDAGNIVIDFGDGSARVAVKCDMDPSQFSSSGAQPISGKCEKNKAFSHKYKKAGTYKAKLMRVGIFAPTPADSTQVLDTVTIKVGDDGDTPTPTTSDFNASPRSGAAPLSVRFSTEMCESDSQPEKADFLGYVIDFGDSESVVAECNSALAWDGVDPVTGQRTGGTKYQANYTYKYTTEGTYKATLVDGAGKVVDTQTIKVGNTAVDDTQEAERILARIVVEKMEKADGVAHGKQVKLANGNVKNNSSWFWLTNNGEFVKDKVGAKSVAGAQTFPGLTVSRLGTGEVRIALTGKNESGSMYEFSEGYIEVKGPAKITQVAKIGTEKHASYGEQFNAKLTPDYIRRVNQTRADFGLLAGTGVDVLAFTVEPTGEVLGASTSKADELAASLDTLDAALATLETKVAAKGQVLGVSTMTTNDRFAAVLDTLDAALDQVEASL